MSEFFPSGWPVLIVMRWAAALFGFIVLSACATWLCVRLLSDLFRYVPPIVLIYASVAIILGWAEFMHLTQPTTTGDEAS